MRLTVGIVLFTSNLTVLAQPMYREMPISPVDGWTEFESQMGYPELARRIALEGLFYVFIKIDTSGTIDSISVWGANSWNDSRDTTNMIFIKRIEQVVRSTKWAPAKTATGRPKESSLVFPMVFRMQRSHPPLIIDGKPNSQNITYDR